MKCCRNGKASHCVYEGARFESCPMHVSCILTFSSISSYLLNCYFISFSRSVRNTLRHSPPPNPHILRYVPKLSVIVSLVRSFSARLVSSPVVFGCRPSSVAGSQSGCRLCPVAGFRFLTLSAPWLPALVILFYS